MNCYPMEMNIKKLTPTAVTPTRGSNFAAGYDLYADSAEPIFIAPHSTEKISTGIAVELPRGTFGGVFARSGLATKQGLRPSNCVGVVDSDYRGDVIVALHNDTDTIRTISPYERIAQFIVIPYLTLELKEVEELTDTLRGEKGFGSTGFL